MLSLALLAMSALAILMAGVLVHHQLQYAPARAATRRRLAAFPYSKEANTR